MTSQLSEFLKWADEMERSADALLDARASFEAVAGNRRVASLLRRAATLEKGYALRGEMLMHKEQGYRSPSDLLLRMVEVDKALERLQ